MGLTLNGIEVSYSEAISAARDLESASETLKKAYGHCETAEQNVTASWTGDNVSRYLTLLGERKGAIKEEYDLLDELAAAIRKTAALYRDQQLKDYDAQQAKAKKQAKKGH